MGFLDRLRRRPAHDDASLRRLLEDNGASSAEAEQIVRILSERLSAEEIHTWLADPEQSHPVPDPASEAKWGVVLDWTPINAVIAGRTNLVIEEARRYVEGGAGKPS